MLAATASALSAALWFLIAHEVTRKLFEERWAQLTSAAVCALVGATSFTVWNQSVVNEKVYTVSLLQLTVVVWLAVRWTRHPGGAAADRLLIVIAYLLALGYTIHPAGYLAAPCVAAVVLLLAPKTFLRPRLAASGRARDRARAFAVSRSSRSARRITRALNEGEPTACTSGFAVGCTLSGTTLERVRLQVGRAQYEKPDLSARQAPFGAQLGMWWQYFTWQWFRDPHALHPLAQTLLALARGAARACGRRQHTRAPTGRRSC